MFANPGGNVAAKDVVGRDLFIKRFWRTLEQTGVILVAERRMGKTTIINKMKEEPWAGTLLLADDVEGVSLALEFVERIASNISKHLSHKSKAKTNFMKLWSTLGGTEIAGVFKLPDAKKDDWKVSLTKMIGDLVDHQEDRIVLIWDEFPWMLQKIGRKEGAATVADLIDTLRALRQQHKNLRMVFTGSIGLHHVIGGLQDEGFANSPLNDMRTLEVPPLDHTGAATLAQQLIKGGGLSTDQDKEIVELITAQVDRVPYYIHHVIAGLADGGETPTLDGVADIIKNALLDAQDPWKLEHYRSRLKEYYGERADLVRTTLNILADHDALSLDQLREQTKLQYRGGNQASQRLLDGDAEGFRDLVKLMLRDHYLERNDQGAYGFRFQLIKRWWQLEM